MSYTLHRKVIIERLEVYIKLEFFFQYKKNSWYELCLTLKWFAWIEHNNDLNCLVEAKIEHNVWFYYLSVCQDSGPHMSVGPLRDEITSGVPTCPESSQCSCVSLTPSCCDLWVYMFCCWWCDSCYLTNVVIFFILTILYKSVKDSPVFTIFYNEVKYSPSFYNII